MKSTIERLDSQSELSCSSFRRHHVVLAVPQITGCRGWLGLSRCSLLTFRTFLQRIQETIDPISCWGSQAPKFFSDAGRDASRNPSKAGLTGHKTSFKLGSKVSCSNRCNVRCSKVRVDRHANSKAGEVPFRGAMGWELRSHRSGDRWGLNTVAFRHADREWPGPRMDRESMTLRRCSYVHEMGVLGLGLVERRPLFSPWRWVPEKEQGFHSEARSTPDARSTKQRSWPKTQQRLRCRRSGCWEAKVV